MLATLRFEQATFRSGGGQSVPGVVLEQGEGQEE